VNIHAQVVVFDAADLTAVSSFWAGVLGGSVDREDDWHMVLDRDGRARIGVQLAPNHVPPQWPVGDQQQQVHLDLWVTDLEAAHEEVMALGATLLQSAADPNADELFQVYADPAGHPFCLCWYRRPA
jgi:predicted enzyme related to lactoylglutathione lyase